MFGKKQVLQIEEVKEVLTTKDMLTREVGSYRLDIDHLGKLFAITDGRIGCDIEMANKLKDRGFVWFVKPEFILKFEHHAVLCGDFEGGFPTIGWAYANQGMRNIYVGDIPESVLDKIAIVKDLGIKYITIHSMQPLPLAYRSTDPIAVGWFFNPQISLSRLPSGGSRAMGNPGIAFVIGMWDMEKELEVL